VSRILTLHPLAAPVDHAAHHRASDRLAATVPDSTGHTAWPVGTGPGPDGVMPGGSESWYRDSLAKRLAKGDLWARLEAAGARYEIGGDSETATADVYLPPGCEALADEVRAWGRRMGAEARDAGAWLRDALETTSGTPVYPTTIPRSEVTISVPVTPGPVVYGELIDGVFVSDTDLFVAEERKRATGFALDEPPDPSGFDKAVVRVRWPGAWAQLVDEGGYDYPRWGILGTRLDVCPTGDTEAEAWAEAARRAGEASR
jgi:hypothetical protein